MESLSPESDYARRLWGRFKAYVPSERPDESSSRKQDWAAVREEGVVALTLPATAEEAGSLAVEVQRRGLTHEDECLKRLEEHIEALRRQRFSETWNDAIERYEEGRRKAIEDRIGALEEARGGYQAHLENNHELAQELRRVRKRACAGIEAGREDERIAAWVEEGSTISILCSELETWKEAHQRVGEHLSKCEIEESRLTRLIQECTFRYNVFNLLLDEELTGEGLRPVSLTEEKTDQEPLFVEGPPEDLFKGRGTKNRTKAKRYARELAELFTNTNEDIPSEWSGLHGKVEGNITGRNKVWRVREAFKDHPEAEEPENPEALCEACYHFFPNITVD